MEIELFIQKKKKLYSSLMEFFDNSENIETKTLIKDFEKQENIKNKEEIISVLHLLSQIADNHHWLPNFLDKLRNIIHYLIQEIKSQITDFEIYKIFKNNKRVLLMLFEQKIITSDEQILLDIMKIEDQDNFPYSHYLYSGIKSFIDEKEIKSIESNMKENYDKLQFFPLI